MTKIKFLLLVNILFWSTLSLASVYNYGVDNIPDQLLKNANAVVRIDHMVFNLKSPGTATLTHKYAVTILNKNADRQAHFVKHYDKNRKITSIKGYIYDKFGKQIRKIKKKEIIDQTAVSNGSLYDDNRIKVVEIIQNNYPYTIEFEYKVKYSGLLIYPPWNPIPGYKVSVQESSYQATIPKGMDFRFKVKNFSPKAQEKTTDKGEEYLWTLENFKAIKSEPYSPNGSDIFPLLFLAPNEFEYDGYKGNMESWQSYGKWVYDLADGREELEASTVAEVKNLVAGVENVEEKIKIIYEHLQSKTRYISIQLGIGGLQPFQASVVDKNGYGDCKALSNYTRAMLKAAGINSYHATIGAGRGNTSIEPDFPFKGFTNHMILCVPLESDTIWLECTSQNQPFGFLGSFTDDRNALLITEEGGKIVRTTRYDQAVNTQIRTAKVKIDGDGNARANVVTKYKGLQYENVDYQFRNNEEEQKDALYERLDISNMEIEKFNYSQLKDRIPEATEELDITIKNYASSSGKRIFIPLNILNKRKRAPKRVKNRKTDVVLNYAFIDTDEIIYEFPKYFKVEHLPKPVSFESDFGSYQATVTQKDNIITYTRTVSMPKKTFSPERYKDLLSFYKKMVKEDKMKLVIVGKDRP